MDYMTELYTFSARSVLTVVIDFGTSLFQNILTVLLSYPMICLMRNHLIATVSTYLLWRTLGKMQYWECSSKQTSVGSETWKVLCSQNTFWRYRGRSHITPNELNLWKLQSNSNNLQLQQVEVRIRYPRSDIYTVQLRYSLTEGIP